VTARELSKEPDARRGSFREGSGAGPFRSLDRVTARDLRNRVPNGEAIMFSVATFERITVNPAVCTGKPCIRNLRFPVSRLLGLLAAGQTREAILQAYPYLESADIDQALGYAASLAEDETVEFVTS
jgi:uncharacterized protein (DUF433 family)